MSEYAAIAQQQNASRSQQSALKVVNFQRQIVNRDDSSALPEFRLDTVSSVYAESRLGFDFSRVPALTSKVRQNRTMLRTQPIVQRFPEDGASDSSLCPACPEAKSEQNPATAELTSEAAITAPKTALTPVPSEPTEETATPGEVALPGLIVKDSATELATGQMKKSEFLSQLRAEVCRTVEAALAGTGRTTDDCPYLNHWFDFYSKKDSMHVERAIRRYAPGASNATTAREYISAVTQRARQSAETWARTGEITGVPEGIPIRLPGLGLIGGLVSGIGSIFFKARNGGARAADDPQAIQAKLGVGQPLESSVRSRMESAFGMDFSHVRAHTDSTAAGLVTQFNARAFTVGEHVAFGAREYKPGTMIGDALIAHELAHVVQQDGTSVSVVPMEVIDVNSDALETDADKSAVGAVASLWDGSNDVLKDFTQSAVPHLRSGLRLQRCGTTRGTTVPSRTATVPTTSDTCPSSIELESTTNMTTGGLERGYRTAYGIMSVMHLPPDDRDWSSAQVYERVTQTSSTCPGNWNLCTGTDRPFPIGQERYSTILGTLPAQRNRFYDFHTSRWNRSRLHDRDQNPTGMDSCRIVCNQRYVCGNRELGRFTITRNFRKSRYRNRDVTIVDVTKT